MTNWPDEPSPHRHDYSLNRQREEAQRAAETNRQHRARLEVLKGKLLDRVDDELDNLAARQKARAEGSEMIATRLSVPEARRRLAHIVGVHKVCSRAACRRGGACRGEPKQCLAVAIPLLPLDVVAALALQRRGRGRTR
ncbi:hypothetical protein [Undibacter mobilis]|uniref:Uncharacterized protein n=1 Tax=Undibacter mobilis TaxID=2292256 RepID=A0A371B165_9BRAD|nr:hypothetical protein [Undibacter mobilis]RDV01325.1 hypothetical protein DXH78_19055 [Undibacter mobilis]